MFVIATYFWTLFSYVKNKILRFNLIFFDADYLQKTIHKQIKENLTETGNTKHEKKKFKY